MKIKARKALALITSFVMLAVSAANIGFVFASDEYSHSFIEDFSNLSINEAAFDAESNTAIYGGKKLPAVVFAGGTEKVLAESVDGSRWVTSKNCGFMGYAKTFFYDDKLIIESYTAGLPSLTIPSCVNLKTDIDIKGISNFKFTTYPKDWDGYAGAKIFVSENENDYIWVGYKEGGCEAGAGIKGLFHNSAVAQAFVIKVVNGVPTTIGITSESGGAENETGNWRSNITSYLSDAVEWDISVDDGVISWTAKKVNKNTGAVSATWTSSYCDEDTIRLTSDLSSDGNGGKWYYPLSFSATLNYAGFDDLEITYYDSTAPEKMKMTLCSNLADGQNMNGDGVIKFNQSSGGTVVGINCASLAGQTIGLSEDGSLFTDVVLDASGIWTADAERSVYSYARLYSLQEVPEDLLIFGDMSAQVYDVTRFAAAKIYETMGGAIIGDGRSLVLSSEEGDAFVFAEAKSNNEIYAKRGGEVDIKYTSSEGKVRSAKIRIVDELTRVIESGDPAKMREYLEKQNGILEILNNAIKANDTAAVFDFFTSTEQSSFYGIDAVKTNEISDLFDTSSADYDALKAERFAKRIITHTEGFRASTLDELYDFESVCLKEIRTDLASEAADADALKTALYDNNDILKLPLDNKYYKEHEDKCLASLAERKFESYSELSHDFEEVYIIEAFKSAGLSAEYAANLITDSQEEIGYDEAKFNKISDVRLLARELLADTDDINTIEELKSAIDSYKEAEESSGSRKTGGGGGGSRTGGVSVTTPPSDTVIPQKPATEPFSDRAQLFSDVATDHWSYEAIRYMAAKGAASGYEDGSFLPDKAVTRAEFVKLALTGSGIAVEGSGEGSQTDKVKKAIDRNGDGLINSKDLVEVDTNGDGVIDDRDKVAIDKNEDGVLDDKDKVDGEYQYMFKYDYEYEYVDADTDSETETGGDDEEEIAFSDVQKTDWYYPYLVSAKNAGLFMGDSSGSARPNDLITKEECAAICYRLINIKGYNLAENNEIIRFNDESEISDWASYAVFKLQVMGIVNGYNGGFAPKSNATRAESAKMIFEIMSKAAEVQLSE